jgi:hypothetical protein
MGISLVTGLAYFVSWSLTIVLSLSLLLKPLAGSQAFFSKLELQNVMGFGFPHIIDESG